MDAINVNVASYTLRDLRDGTLEEYPIVKIGTQYWMKAELRATAYQTGEKLLRQTNLGKDAGYFKPANYDIYFYNGEAVLSGKLNPSGWKIPSEDDWNQLRKYTNESAASLKAGEWEVLSAGKVSPIDNLTMFNAYPVGMWFNGKHYSVHKMTGFWSWDESKKAFPNKPFSSSARKTNSFQTEPWSPTKITIKPFLSAVSKNNSLCFCISHFFFVFLFPMYARFLPIRQR